jgi:hypothetical protein
MAKKPSITTVSSGYQSTTTINSNTQNLRDAFDNTLSLDGSTPNAMQADFDMNSNDILNVDKLYINGLYIDGQPVSAGTLNYNGVIKETQTATSGQTVFNLTTMVYNPGINSLSVYVDGVYQNPSTYTENNSTRITFSAGLHVGAIVDFVALSINEITGGADATTITYTPNAQSLYGTSTLTAKSALDQISNEGTGSSKVGFLQSGTGATNRTVQAKLRDTVSVKDFGAVGDGSTDDTDKIQLALNTGKNIIFPSGSTYYVAGTLNVTQNNTSICIEGGATVYHAGTGTKCFNITGSNVTVYGEGVLYSLGTQDSTNSAITYAAIWVSGEGCTIKGIRIQRVTRCGIYFNDVGFATITDITIDGEFDTSTWINTNTVLFGIFADPSTTSQGQILVSSSKLSRLVSGIGVGNYGSANDGRGFSFTSNLFIDCADHGIYCVFTKGTTVSANSFDRCGAAISLSGSGHVISGNTVTNFGSARSVYDKVSINIREPINCIISDNTLIGPYGGGYSGIELSNISGTAINYNIVDSNVIINTGSVQGRMFVIGTSATTETMLGNTITNNVFKGPGNNNEAVAVFLMKSTFYGVDNIFSNNLIHSTNQWQCLWINRQKKMTIHGNKFIWEYSAGSAATYDIVYINDISYCTFRSNSLSVIGGTNVTIRGITSNASSNNWYTENQSTLTDSSVTAATPIFNAGVSDRVINNTWNINRIEGTAAPTTGTWALGDVVYNTTPTAGGGASPFIGWVCTTAGTPGTWKTFGAISA